MPAAVSATATDLPESRVRVEAEVPADVLDRRLEQVARTLAQDMKLPGFRKGKIPPQVVLQRLGRETVLDEAIRSTLGRWYLQAVDAAGIHPVGDPDVSLGDLPGTGEPLTFSFEIGVRPTATLGTYKGLEVGRREPEADEEAVSAQLEELRTRMSKLEGVEEPAGEGDFVVMDYVGSIDGEEFEGGAGTDQLIELGSGRLIPGFEEQLTGAVAGEERTLDVTFPDDYGAEHLAGRRAQFAVTIKEIRRRVLPELDDAFASDAAGFDTLDELREDIAGRIRELDEQRAEGEFREAVLDAAVEQATVSVPEALVEARGRELLDRMLHQLEHQGINREMYFQISGRTEEDLLAESAEDAERTLKREAVLAAIVEAESLEPSDGDVLDALQDSAASENTTPEKLRDRLEKAGRLDDLRDDLAQRAALDLLVEHATAIDPGRAAAREQLWTPGDD
ncbi:MAG: trigger factor [Solirubrobacteraceae bacterium]|nr:trigger factor [Solirubrobacteraceae bacterium]